MATALIGWELGSGRGHVERLVPIVSAFRDRGWRVIAALRAPALGSHVLGPLQAHRTAGALEIIQAPALPPNRKPSLPAHSLPQILANLGFAEAELVEPLVMAWDAMLARYKPSLIISDSAPGLNVAARGRIPSIVIGNGWTIPPYGDLPPILPPHRETDRSVQDAADAVLSAMSALKGRGTATGRFCELLRGDRNMVCSLEETDPYRQDRTEDLYWPFEIPPPTMTPIESRVGGIIYLPEKHPAREPVQRFAEDASIPFDAFFNDGQASAAANLSIHDRPINFAKGIPKKRLVIHHGGLGTAIWCIANHIPQLLFPTDLEKLLIAKGVVGAGFGLALRDHSTQSELRAAANRAMELCVPPFSTRRMTTLAPAESLNRLMSYTSASQ